jgi:hypothetical protein
MIASAPSIIDMESVANQFSALKSTYQSAHPYPHIVIDNFLNPVELQRCVEEFDQLNNSEGWINYVHFNEKKRGLNKAELLPPHIKKTIDALNTPEMLKQLSKLTGIENLQHDEKLEGGGIHQSTRGGFLNIHADFTVHPHHRHWQRRINILVYLNPNWKEEWGGKLELWDRQMKGCEASVLPVFNRCVIFNTDPDSYHGHPEPMTCPEGTFRRSIALYYYTIEENPMQRSTTYVARPTEKHKQWRIKLDNYMIAVYTWIKGKSGANDGLVSKVLNMFSGKK